SPTRHSACRPAPERPTARCGSARSTATASTARARSTWCRPASFNKERRVASLKAGRFVGGGGLASRHRMRVHRTGFALLLLLSLGWLGATGDDPDPGTPRWRTWGGDLHNRHFAASETLISPSSVASLRPRWVLHTTGNVSAVPTLSDRRLYVPDAGPPIVGG